VVPSMAGWVGAYPLQRRILRIERFITKRRERVWEKVVKYDVRKNFADQRLRVKGRFVKKEDEVRCGERGGRGCVTRARLCSWHWRARTH
jgi:hypothetical protein